MTATRGEPLRWLQDAVQQETDNCVLWPFCTNADGYGRIAYNGRVENAQRVALMLTVGQPPDNRRVGRHSCDTPACVNPRHLGWGTQYDNIEDRKIRGRTSNHHVGKTNCKHGHEFSLDNTYITKAGYRSCRACHAESERKYRSRAKG